MSVISSQNKIKLELNVRDADVLLQALGRYRGPWDGEVPDNQNDKEHHERCMVVANYYQIVLEGFLHEEYRKKLQELSIQPA